MTTDPHASRAVARRLPLAGALVLSAACALDLACQPLPLTPHLITSVLALAVGLGALAGAGLRVVFALVARLPRPLPYLCWPIATCALALELGWRLGAQKQLHGVYNELALLVIAAVATASVLFSCVLCAMQPFARGREAFLPSRGLRLRALVSALLVASAFALGVADRVLYVDLYPIAHAALRGAAIVLALLGVALSHELLRLPALTRRTALGLAIACTAVLWTLDERAPETLQAVLARSWPRSLLSAARVLTDLDGDGYTALLGGGDCRPFDARVHPGAREIPDNGIDDNCALGDAHAHKPPASRAGSAAVDTSPVPIDVVLITVDSLRRDRVGVYRDPHVADARVLTPALDAFASTATLFEHAYTAGGWTTLAIPALMRGVYPRRLRWTRFYETSSHRLLRAPLAPQLEPGESPKWLFAFPIDDPHPSLAQRLAARGMQTFAVVDDGRSEILRPGTGFELGFGHYTEVNPGAVARRDDMTTALLAIAALQQVRVPEHVFLWVHFFGVHSPSETHPGVPQYGKSVADRYDHEIRYFDRALEQLLRAIERRARPTAIFITADHGEELEARVRHHGYSVDEAIIAVPLIARVPGWPVGRTPALVSLVDLVPTVLALTRSAPALDLDGSDIASLLGQRTPAARTLLSDSWRFDVNQNLVADFATAYDAREKLVVDELGYGALHYDKAQRPNAEPSLRFDPRRDRLSRRVYGYLEDTGGMPVPRD